jgi:hypothetical protein
MGIDNFIDSYIGPDFVHMELVFQLGLCEISTNKLYDVF